MRHTFDVPRLYTLCFGTEESVSTIGTRYGFYTERIPWERTETVILIKEMTPHDPPVHHDSPRLARMDFDYFDAVPGGRRGAKHKNHIICYIIIVLYE